MVFCESICDNKLFLKLYKNGKYTACGFLTAYYLPNKLPINRIGITTGKKIGCAVKRNRARRIIRSAYQHTEMLFPIGYDIVFVAREKIEGLKSTDIEEFFVKRVIKDINKLGATGSAENHKQKNVQKNEKA